MDQSDVSRLEGREDFEECLVSTLRRYIAALGGQLDLVASFGDKRIILSGVQPGSEGVPANKPRRSKMAATSRGFRTGTSPTTTRP